MKKNLQKLLVAIAAMMICTGASAIDKVLKKVTILSTAAFTSVEDLTKNEFCLQNSEKIVLYTPSGWDVKSGSANVLFTFPEQGGYYKLETFAGAGEDEYLIGIYDDVVGNRRKYWSGDQYLNAQPSGSTIFGLAGTNDQLGQDMANGAVWIVKYDTDKKMFSFKNKGRAIYLAANETQAIPSEDVTYWNAYDPTKVISSWVKTQVTGKASELAELLRTTDDIAALESAKATYNDKKDAGAYAEVINALIDKYNAAEKLFNTYSSKSSTPTYIAVKEAYKAKKYKNAAEIEALLKAIPDSDTEYSFLLSSGTNYVATPNGEPVQLFAFTGRWASTAPTPNSFDAAIYKSMTVEFLNATEVSFNSPYKDAKGNQQWGGVAAKSTNFLFDFSTKGSITDFCFQNTQESGTSKLSIKKAYLTKLDGTTETLTFNAPDWGGTKSLASVSAQVQFDAQYAALDLTGLENIYGNKVIKINAIDDLPSTLQYCIKYADGEEETVYPAIGLIDSKHAEIVIDRPMASISLQWTGEEAGVVNFESITYEIVQTLPYKDPAPELEGLIKIPQVQDDDASNLGERAIDGTNTVYTLKANAVSVAYKIKNVDVKDCDYVIIKFAEATPDGVKLSFYGLSDNSTLDLPAGVTEYKYVFAEDEKCAIVDDVLPQITALTIWNGTDKTLKVAGIYKHVAEKASGDVNNDKVVDIADVAELVNVIISGETNSAADIDGNGNINIKDIETLVNTIIGSKE